MGTSTLSWYADRGFELTAEVANKEVALRMDVVPIPADGTLELREGVELNSLDVLFKASVTIEGEPGQVLEAKVTLVDESGKTLLRIDAQCEDVETGERVPFKGDLEVQVPEEAPEKDGPRPEPLDEDALDWDDETTLENLVVSESGTAPQAPAEEKGSRGLKALLEALASLDDEEASPSSSSAEAPAALPAEPERSEGDQSMGAADEAKGLLELLLRAENLELEDGANLDGLVEGTVAVLALQLGPEAKASKLSSWLLDQDSVADLFIGDEDLAVILEQW
ncbi:MAG: hypothetical protein KTR31_24925 [Myxococcales bacterium]|nr:hypothetical protein [Myxococcales bacterium]